MNGLNSPRTLMLLALMAVLVGRGVSQGWPGTLTGFDGELTLLSEVGAHLTQFSALVFIALATRLTVLLIVARAVPVSFQALAAGTCGSVTLIGLWSALSSSGRMATGLASTSAVLALLTAGSSGILALKYVGRRAASLVCLGCVTSGALHLAARWVALKATAGTSQVLYFGSQLVATAGGLVELMTLAAMFYWILKPSPTWLKAAAAIGLLCAPALALHADGSGTSAQLLRNTLEQLSAHPDPLFPAWLGRSVELWGLLAATCALVAYHRLASLTFVAGMAALSRSSADVPLYGVFLLAAALALQLPQFGQKPADQSPV